MFAHVHPRHSRMTECICCSWISSVMPEGTLGGVGMVGKPC